ncbi:MAG: hypothetical protein WA151_22030, partial [Desulfatirhabdiaceae bacterium]
SGSGAAGRKPANAGGTYGVHSAQAGGAGALRDQAPEKRNNTPKFLLEKLDELFSPEKFRANELPPMCL